MAGYGYGGASDGCNPYHGLLGGLASQSALGQLQQGQSAGLSALHEAMRVQQCRAQAQNVPNPFYTEPRIKIITGIRDDLQAETDKWLEDIKI